MWVLPVFPLLELIRSQLVGAVKMSSDDSLKMQNIINHSKSNAVWKPEAN
jgi:hypothetical protein